MTPANAPEVLAAAGCAPAALLLHLTAPPPGAAESVLTDQQHVQPSGSSAATTISVGSVHGVTVSWVSSELLTLLLEAGALGPEGETVQLGRIVHALLGDEGLRAKVTRAARYACTGRRDGQCTHALCDRPFMLPAKHTKQASHDS